MPFTTYTELQAAIPQRIERTGDTAVTDILADSIALCESRINKVPDLRLQAMETESLALVLTAGSGALPADFLAMKNVAANTTAPIGLDYTDPGTYKREIAGYAGTDDSYPFYTIIGSSIRSISSSTLAIIYYAKVPALASAVGGVNWLLTKAPEVYLYGTILELGLALENDAWTDKYGSLFSAAIQGLIGSETFNRGGVMVKRASGPTP